MQLLTERILWLYGIGVNYTRFLKATPYHWDKQKKLQTLSTHPSELRSWKIVVFILILHELFLTVRLCQSFYGMEGTLVLYSVQIVNHVGCTICFIIEMTLVILKENFMHFSNRIMFFSKKLDGNLVLIQKWTLIKFIISFF